MTLLFAHAAAWIDVVHDDAFITFRYAARLAAGGGPSYNDGELVEGYTNFAWMLGLAAYLRAGGTHPMWMAKAMGLLSAALALLLSRRLAVEVLRGGDARSTARWALLPPVLLALSGAFVAQSVSGLETPLYVACVLGAVVAACAEDRGGSIARSALWLAAGTLVRPEAPLTAIVLCAVDASVRRARDEPRWWRTPARRLLALALLLAPYAAWKWATFGALVPNTFVAKHVPLSSRWLLAHAWPALAGALASSFGYGAVVALAIAGAWRRRDLPTRLVAAAAAAHFAYATWVGVDTLPGGRFYLPALALALPLAVAGVRRAVGAGRAAAVVAIAALLLQIGVAARADGELRTLMHEITNRLYGAHGELIKVISQHQARVVALRDIGIVGWYLPQIRIVDLAGLTDRRIAASPGELGEKLIPLDELLSRDVDILVAHAERPPAGDDRRVSLTTNDLSPTIRALLTDPRFERTFRLARSIPFSGDHHLLVFARRR